MLMMAASPEDVSRVKTGTLQAGGIQMLRDVESIWGVRFLIRRVENEVGQSQPQQEEAIDDEDDEDDDEEDEGDSEDEDRVLARKSKKVKTTPLQAAEEFILSCRGVGVRGHRKAT